MKKLFWGLTLLGTIGLFALTCTFQIQPWESVIRARFGQPGEPLTQPGLYFRWPAPIDSLYRIDRRLRLFESELGAYLTQDKRNLVLSGFLAWKVKDPSRFLASVKDPTGADDRLRDVLSSELGAIMGEYELSELVSEEREESALAEIHELLTRRVDAIAQTSFGIEVEAARIQRFNFHRQNKSAVFHSMQSERQAEALQIRSQGDRDADNIVQKAKSEAATMTNEANLEADKIVSEARASSLRIVSEAYEKDPELFQFLQRLDTMEAIVDEQSLFLIPNNWDLLRLFQGPPELLLKTHQGNSEGDDGD